MFATSYDLAKRQCTLCYQPEERQEKMPPPLLWKIPLAQQGPLGYQQVCMYWKTTIQHWLYKLIFHSANKYGLIVPYQLILSPSISQPSHSIVTERTNKNNRKPTPYCLQRVRGFTNDIAKAAHSSKSFQDHLCSSRLGACTLTLCQSSLSLS